MTQEAALFNFFNSFGLTAYPNISVPDDAKYPYITYPVMSGNWTDTSFPSVYIYTKNAKVTDLTAYVRLFSDRLKNGGETVECDNGMLWITTGNPLVNYLTDATDETVRFAVLNLNVEHITT